MLQKVADKSFITPTALGQFFNDIYNNTIAELQNSKAKLVDDITRSLEAGYRKQIENLNYTIATVEKTKQSELNILVSQLQTAREEKFAVTNRIQYLQKKLDQSKGISTVTIILIIAALIIGLLLGRAIFM